MAVPVPVRVSSCNGNVAALGSATSVPSPFPARIANFRPETTVGSLTMTSANESLPETGAIARAPAAGISEGST